MEEKIYEISQKAKTISLIERKNIIRSFKETDLHNYLKSLFESMESDYYVEITHGSNELGNDLVMVKKDTITTNVIGVIVKRGDITGKTLGEVDELCNSIKQVFTKKSSQEIRQIKSQVKQAITHPADLKEIYPSMQILKLIIIVTGRISRNAKVRIKGETPNAIIELHGIDWLVNNFTEYYPQIFFQGKILDFIINKVKQLEQKHWLTQENLNLSDYYVEPLVKKKMEYFKIDKSSSIKKEKDKVFSISGLNSILTKSSKIILTGEPGSGKSMALVKIAINSLRKTSALKQINKNPNQKTEIPLLVHSRDVLASKNYKELIYHFLKEKDLQLESSIIFSTLLVDALDEVNQEQRMEIINKIITFSDELDCPVIITSRKIDIIKNPEIDFEKYELLPFKFNQIIKLCEKLVSNKECLERIKKGLTDIKNQIPLIPLSLLLLIRVIEERKEIPASITEIYSKYFELVLGRWDIEKGLEILTDYIVCEHFISELAYEEFYKKNKLQIKNADFKMFSKNYTQEHDLSCETLDKSIKRTEILLINENIEFKHRTFLDYFVAKSIFDKREEIEALDDFLVKIYFDAIWRDVLLYYIGLHRKIKKRELLEKIFNYKSKNISSLISKFMVGRLLQAGWYSKEEIKKYGVVNLVSYEGAIREYFLDAIKDNKKVPGIYIDFLMLGISEISISSIFLSKASKDIFIEMLQKMDNNNIAQIFILLWALRDLIPLIEFKNMVSGFFEKFSSVKNIDLQKQIKMLLFLSIIEKKDDKIQNLIDKKLKSLSMSNPKIISGLLPETKNGFRKEKREK